MVLSFLIVHADRTGFVIPSGVRNTKKVFNGMMIDGDEYHIRMNGRVYHCALDVTMDLVGGKWKTIVLWYLRKEKKRFSELRRLIPGITEKMLSMQLRQLEKDGFVRRKVYAEVPPRVEYSLTPYGRTLLPLLKEIAKWGRKVGRKHGSVERVERSVKKSSASLNPRKERQAAKSN